MSEEAEFPKTIEEFGYHFNEKGELRDIETGGRFEFFYRTGDRYYNQRRYEELGDVIGEFIENELVEQYNLIRKIIPVELKEDDNIAKSRIYISDDAQECQTLLLLIQGSGVVRPGQWARQVIINDSLELGTMFPYIRKAQELKWGIVIFNPNENYGSIINDGEVSYCRISGSESPQNHCLYVWDKFVTNARAKEILIVAHSYGGICTSYLLDQYADDFYKRVKGIALTDSVHSSGMIPTHSRHWFQKKAFNWIKSDLPMNDPIREANQFYGCNCFSAGHQKHEYTSGVAFESVFEFLQFRSRGNKDNDEITNQKNETSEQSVTNNNEDDKESRVVESLNEETKLQTQNGGKSITHDKGTNDMDIDELTEATNKTSSENDTKLDSSSAMEMEVEETSSEKDTKATGESQLDSSSAMETEAISSEKDTKTTVESQIDSSSAMETEAISSAKATGESQIDSSSAMETKATSSEKDNKATGESQIDSSSAMETEAISPAKATGESQIDSSSAMETEAISPAKATGESQIDSSSAMETEAISPAKATGESQIDSSSAMETEATSSEKDTKVTGASQLDSSSTMETEELSKATSSEKDTKTTGESQINSSSAMETEETSSEKDTKVTGASQLDSSSTMETEKLSKAISSEKDIKTTGEPQLNSSSDVIIVDETVATNAISSEKDTTAIEGLQPDSGLTGSETPNAIMNEQVEIVAKATNETTTKTEKDTLKDFMNNAITNEVTVKNDISENEKINNNIPKENTTDSNFNTDAQALKDDNNSKDSSQNNNV